MFFCCYSARERLIFNVFLLLFSKGKTVIQCFSAVIEQVKDRYSMFFCCYSARERQIFNVFLLLFSKGKTVIQCFSAVIQQGKDSYVQCFSAVILARERRLIHNKNSAVIAAIYKTVIQVCFC